MKGKHIPRSELKTGVPYICGDDDHMPGFCWRNSEGKVVPFVIEEFYEDDPFDEGVKRMRSLDGAKETHCCCADLDHIYEWLLDDATPDPWQPKRGEWVEVSDDGEEWFKRIYLVHIEGARYLHTSVALIDEDKFKQGEQFHVTPWKLVRPLPKKQSFTRKEIADRIGIPVEELEITE